MLIAVLNQKGGVGKTTLAVNLAAATHLAGGRALVLDLDSQGSSFDWYSARKEGSMLAGLNVVRAPTALSLTKLQDLARGYDVVFVDGPPRLGDITRAAAVAADVVLLPMREGGFDWWAIADTLELLDSADTMRASVGREPVRRVFALNAVPAQATKLKRGAIEAVTQLGDRAPLIIANRVNFAETVLTGESVLTLHPTSPAAHEIRLLHAAVLGGADAART